MSNVEGTLAERGARYGDFADHALICQSLQDVMRGTVKLGGPEGQLVATNWNQLDATKKQALTVIADKIARILNGDPEYADNWHDIQGYARLVEERLKVPNA